MGDRVAVLKRGVLQQAEAPQYLYENPDNLFVAGFIGSPAMNIAEGTIEKADGGYAVRLGSTTSLSISPKAIDKYPRVADYVGQTVAVGLRPEHFFRPDGSVPTGQTWPGRKVTLVEQLGSEMLIHFGTSAPPVVSEDMREAVDDADAFAELERQAREGGQVFTARLEPSAPPKVGSLIDLAFRTEHMHFFDLQSGVTLR
jgi:multiple sugar transport system ATP-binding protein